MHQERMLNQSPKKDLSLYLFQMIYVGNASKMKSHKMKMETGFFQKILNKRSNFGKHFVNVEMNF